MAQAGPFLHRELAFVLVAGRHRHDDVDHHRNGERPGIEGDHQAVAGVEHDRTGRQRGAVDGDGDAIGREAPGKAAAHQQRLHALVQKLAVVRVHQHVIDEARTRAEQALVGHAGAGRVGIAAVLEEPVPAFVGLALKDLHVVGVEVHAGFACGFHQRHRTGEVGVVGVAGVEAVRAQAIDVGGAVRGGGGGLGGDRAGVGVLIDFA